VKFHIVKGKIKMTDTEKMLPDDFEMVCISEYLKDVPIELRYSTENNFTGKVIYNFTSAYLRYGTLKKLSYAQSMFKEKGLGIKIWDAFRPVEAQFVMWEVYPDDDYVADPTKGFSTHSRGNTVDITLVDKDGKEIPMPTGFDDFEAMAAYDYDSNENEETTKNAYMLKEIMIKAGFLPSTSEWWHFRDRDVYPVAENFPHSDK
jgi:D-alanyl-D-alanine dipeptidase